jgi:hypothetical protein
MPHCLLRQFGHSERNASCAYGIGALLPGYHTEDGHLLYAGRAGTGCNDHELARPARGA